MLQVRRAATMNPGKRNPSCWTAGPEVPERLGRADLEAVLACRLLAVLILTFTSQVTSKDGKNSMQQGGKDHINNFLVFVSFLCELRATTSLLLVLLTFSLNF